MQITLTFVAESGEDLRTQMLNFLGMRPLLPLEATEQAQADVTPVIADNVVAEAKPAEEIKEKKPKKVSRTLTPSTREQEEQEEQAPEPQSPRAPEALITEPSPVVTVSQPETPSRAVDQGSKSEQVIAGIDATPEMPQEQVSVTPPKEALALKEKVIDALQAAFREGKVQKVRSVLTQYGNGAKSFREIDISAFPAINEALQHGALN